MLRECKSTPGFVARSPNRTLPVRVVLGDQTRHQDVVGQTLLIFQVAPVGSFVAHELPHRAERFARRGQE